MLNTFMLTGGNFIIDALKHLTFALDKAIYSLVQFAYSVFYYLANATILNETIVTNFTYRMYTLLGIIMVFVLAFNLLSYIVDPDKITDKKTGASSFVKDVILAIVIISVSPMLFTKLYSLQSKILTSGVIENLILGGATSEGATNAENWATGENSDKSLTQYYVDNGGNTMVASVYVAFLYPAGGKFTALDCDPDASKNGQYANYCDAYRKVKEGYGLGAFGDFIANDDYEYTPFLTTVAGIVLLFFMLSFCINLAKRVGKMALIQLIAPVPVTLELLPNKKGLRDNWLKTLGKVYIEVFFYLLVMFFIILLISLIPGTIGKIFSDIVTDGIGPVKLLATVILIYGLLQFGKEAPQMLFDLLGIKTTGIIKEAALRGVKMAGSVTAGLGTAATSMVANGYGAFKNFRGGKIKEGFGDVGGIFSSGITGLARGMYANRTGGFKGIKNRTSTAINENLAHQGEFGKFVGKHKKGIAAGAAAGATVGATFGGIGAIPGAIVGAVAGAHAKDTAQSVGSWATRSNSYTKLNQQIEAMNKAKGYFKNVTTGFGAYEDATRTLNEAKAKTDYASAYNAWKAANPNKKEKDFIASISSNPKYAEIINAYNQQQNVKNARITNKKEEIINNALSMMQYIDLNPQIGLSAEATAFRDKLKTMVDKDGKIISGSINDIYSTLDDLSTQLGKDITIASRTIERQKQIEEAKKNGNSGASDKK